MLQSKQAEQKTETIPYNRPYMTGRELEYIQNAFERKQLSGNGHFTAKCSQWLEETVGSPKSFLTHSCTDALEMTAILLDAQPGDEVIMPSFTFVTSATAFALRGIKPVFVDIRPDTLNIDEKKLEESITERTKAIVPVHYAGVSCEMDEIMAIARKHKLKVIEDAAHSLMCHYKGTPVGSRGDMSCFSFHETKNLSCGEGGALMVNDKDLIDRAYMVWEKGSNRREFNLGITDKYTWRDLGSSFPPSELSAAYLFAQMENAEEIMAKRMAIFNGYQERFQALAKRGCMSLPHVPEHCSITGHIFYGLVEDKKTRTELLSHLQKNGVYAVFHYIPLDDSPAGQKYGKTYVPLPVTHDVSARIVRFPIWVGLQESDMDRIVRCTEEFFTK